MILEKTACVLAAAAWVVGPFHVNHRVHRAHRAKTEGFSVISVANVVKPLGWAAQPQEKTPLPGCDPAFAALFTPERPVLGRYEACTDSRPLGLVAPADWLVEALEPSDAFGGAGAYDRAAVARLYGGMRPRVARGWTEAADRFEAVTLISPYPNALITKLEPGTLIIRWICDHGGPECKMLNAGR